MWMRVNLPISLCAFFSTHLYLCVSLITWLSVCLDIHVCLHMSSSSSTSCRAISTNISDPLSPPLTIFHCFQQVLRATPYRLLYVGSSWSSCLCTSMWRDPQEYLTYELVPTSPAVSCISGLSNFDSFRDGWSVAIQLLICEMLSPKTFFQYCLHHSCVVAVKLFFQLASM